MQTELTKFFDNLIIDFHKGRFKWVDFDLVGTNLSAKSFKLEASSDFMQEVRYANERNE